MASLYTQAPPAEFFDPASALSNAQQWLRSLTIEEALTATTNWAGAEAIERQIDALWEWSHPGEKPRMESRVFEHPYFWSPYILIGERNPAAQYGE
ncbi:MAG: hypothetical protein IPK16_28160 [Anaerolineales bacterium]|nr:hypothetical protein [Anaerolineales bacterium]